MAEPHVSYWFNKLRGKREPKPISNETHAKHEMAAFFSEEDKGFFLATKGTGTIDFRKADEATKDIFRPLRVKEIKLLIE